jgi:folate-binding protein YgfZ
MGGSHDDGRGALVTNRSSLHPYFVSLGASFTTRADWEVAESFSGWEDEYRAANEAAIVADLSYRGRVRVQGRDHVGFLHNMTSNDIKALARGAGLRAAFLSQKGKLITDMIVYRGDDSILIEMEPDRVERFVDTVSRYIVSEDVELDDVSRHDVLLSIEGPQASELLSSILDKPLPELAPFHFMRNAVKGVPIRLSAVRHGPGPGFDIAVPTDHGVALVEHILSTGQSTGIRPAGSRALEIRRIEAGIPRFGVDMDESHLLLETGMDDAVSFNKGCYIGQEYVARLANRGHLNRKLVGLKLTGDRVPSPGADIVGEDRIVGQVTSATYSPVLESPVALGYVHRDFFDPGTAISIRLDEIVTPATVSNLPFIDSP